MANIGDDRPLRGCEVCGGVDDHPRHACLVPVGYAGAVPQGDVLQKLLDNGISGVALSEAMDAQTTMRHIDCCAAAGCPDGSCPPVVAQTNGVTGKKLLDHLLGG